MDHAYFEFHGPLNDFLPRARRRQVLQHPFDWRASIKDMIESLGVPHAEVEQIAVNGAGVDFEYIVAPDDRIAVYPYAATPEIENPVALRPPFDQTPRFILDTHLGRLAAYLRMMGFDTLYRNDYPDDELAQVSHAETRILLTRDVGLLKRSLVIYGCFVRQTNPRGQVAWAVERFQLATDLTPFKRCIKCNGLLQPVPKADIIDRLPVDTARYYDVFHQCPDCVQIYWKGAHFEKMQALIDELTGQG